MLTTIATVSPGNTQAPTTRHTRRRRRALVPSLMGRHGQKAVRGLFLALAVLSAMCLLMASTARAAPGAGIDPDRACYWNDLCLDAEPDGSLTAWSLWDVGPTPYYISVFNETTGARLALCGFGTSCTTSRYIGPPVGSCWTYVAFVGGSGGSIPPSPVQRTSDRLTKCQQLN